MSAFLSTKLVTMSRRENLPHNLYFDAGCVFFFLCLFFFFFWLVGLDYFIFFASGSCQASPSSASSFPMHRIWRPDFFSNFFLITALILQTKNTSTRTSAQRSSVNQQRRGWFSAQVPAAIPSPGVRSPLVPVARSTTRAARERIWCAMFVQC